MSVILKIDTKELISYTNKLEKMRRFDLPLAVRGTLNKAAFNLKQVSMPVSAAKHFEKRKPNFFKANSRVQMANGWKVSEMRSVVGFVSFSAKENYKSVLELQQQEHGGTIKDRDFIPMDDARIGESSSKMVSAPNRIRKINLGTIVHAKDMKGGSRKQKYIAAAVKAGRGGYITSGLKRQILRKVNSVKYIKGRTVVKSTALYDYKKNRSVKIDSTYFMREASLKSASRLNEYFIQEANRRFAKLLVK